MASRRTRKPGGMTPLFDLEPLAPAADVTAPTINARGRRADGRGREGAATSRTPVSYWIRGIFRFADGEERICTVDAVGRGAQLADDAARFVSYLRESGWLFPEGRAMLVEPLGIAAHDGGLIVVGDTGG